MVKSKIRRVSLDFDNLVRDLKVNRFPDFSEVQITERIARDSRKRYMRVKAKKKDWFLGI